MLGENGVIYYEIKCYSCQTLGKYVDQCPGQTGTNSDQTGIMLSQGQHGIKNT